MNTNTKFYLDVYGLVSGHHASCEIILAKFRGKTLLPYSPPPFTSLLLHLVLLLGVSEGRPRLIVEEKTQKVGIRQNLRL